MIPGGRVGANTHAAHYLGAERGLLYSEHCWSCTCCPTINGAASIGGVDMFGWCTTPVWASGLLCIRIYSQRCYVAAEEQSIHKGMILQGASPYATRYNAGAACIADPCHAMVWMLHLVIQTDRTILYHRVPQDCHKNSPRQQFYFVCMPRSHE
jgi:hypothetical protein